MRVFTRDRQPTSDCSPRPSASSQPSYRLGGHTICLAGAFTAPDPISGGRLEDGLDGAPTGAFTLLHGVHDDVVPVDVSSAFALRLGEFGWPAEVVELDADHGSIAGAAYDAAGDRYVPSDDPRTLAVAREVAERIAVAAGR